MVVLKVIGGPPPAPVPKPEETNNYYQDGRWDVDVGRHRNLLSVQGLETSSSLTSFLSHCLQPRLLLLLHSLQPSTLDLNSSNPYQIVPPTLSYNLLYY
jgi:hypothetical protein